jgi:hypothetical protein
VKVSRRRSTIPKTCKAAAVKKEGPGFYVEVEDVPVPECGMCFFSVNSGCEASQDCSMFLEKSGYS